MPRRTTPFVGGVSDWDTAHGFAQVRVSHCEVDQVLDLAYAWRDLKDWEDFHILEQGWFRTSPCPPNLCGEHRYHLNHSSEGKPGAFYAWLLGIRWSRCP